jgi:hypothetical protein
MIDVVEALNLPVSSEKDAAIGFFLGIIHDVLNTQCMKIYNRNPNRDEINEFYRLLSRRTQEIITVINQQKMAYEQEACKRHFEKINPPDECTVSDIDIDWNINTRKSERSILGIPLSFR